MERSRLRRAAALPLAVLLALGATACSGDDATPEEARRQRVLDRLERSFGEEVAECMIDQFSDTILVALDREGALPQGGDLDEFSMIATTCVVEDGPPGGDGEPGGTDPAAPGSDDSSPTVPDAETDPPDAGPDGAPPDDPEAGTPDDPSDDPTGDTEAPTDDTDTTPAGGSEG